MKKSKNYPRYYNVGNFFLYYAYDTAIIIKNYSHIAKKISVLRSIGVTYPAGFEARAESELTMQASKISRNLQTQGITAGSDKEIIALIAYLQRLGVDIKGNAPAPAGK